MPYKILMLIPYVGELPTIYFPIFLHTCAKNTQIDFLIFNDYAQAANKKYNLPTNVRILPMQLDEFNVRASAALGCQVAVKAGYKLCDLRPMYGHIFADYLADYHFWGHCDMDICLGDLSHFITDDILQTHDIISLRREWISGPFSLYRNADFTNKLYLQSRDWQRIATDEELLRFDETGVLKTSRAMPYPLLAAGQSISDIALEAESITALIARIEQQGDMRIRVFRETLIKESINENMILQYKQGTLSIFSGGNKQHPDGRQYAHYHYITEKNNRFFTFPDWTAVPDVFYIDDTGFYTQEEFQRSYQSIRRRRRLSGHFRYYTRTFPRRVWKKLFGK